MIVSLNLFEELYKTFKLIERGNLVPFSCPFKIVPKNTLSSTAYTPEDFEFQSSSKFRLKHWKLATFILILVPALSGYCYLFESISMFAKAMDIDKFGLFFYMATCVVFYKRENVAVSNFFNELNKFDARNVTPTGRQKPSTRIRIIFFSKFSSASVLSDTDYLRKFLPWRSLLLVVQSVRTTMLLDAFMFGICAGIFPKLSLSLLPSSLFNFQVPVQVSSEFALELLKRLTSSVFSYIAWRLLVNIIFINIYICLLFATFCLYSTFVLFQRFENIFFKFSVYIC